MYYTEEEFLQHAQSVCSFISVPHGEACDKGSDGDKICSSNLRCHAEEGDIERTCQCEIFEQWHHHLGQCVHEDGKTLQISTRLNRFVTSTNYSSYIYSVCN